MISNKNYFRLIKQFPIEKPSKEFNNLILEKCRLNNHKPSIGKPTYLSEICYGLACIIIIISIFFIGFVQTSPRDNNYLIIASNSKLLMNQLISGTYALIADLKK